MLRSSSLTSLLQKPTEPVLDDLVVFAAVAENGGFTAASGRLGLAKGRISTVVRRLEKSLGSNLFVRTTRRVSLTEAGRQLHEQTQPLLRGLAEALTAIGTSGSVLSGTLRISASVDHAVHSLTPALAEFAAHHPGIAVDLRASDRIGDLVTEGIDIAFRVGWLRDSSLRATRLANLDQWLVASPEYLARVPIPRRPSELATRDWIALTLLPRPLTWKFTGRRGRVLTVRMAARLRTDSAVCLRSLVLAGAGITALPRFSIENDVRSERLVRLLPDWTLPQGGIYAVFPPGRYVPARVRAFLEFYRSRINAA